MIDYKFSGRCCKHTLKVKFGDHTLPQVTWLSYIEFFIQNDGELKGNVNRRIQTRWIEWKCALSVVCDRKAPLNLKAKFYLTTIRPVMLYVKGIEYWW